MANIPYVTDDSFQRDVLEADTPVLVDFTADWCPPCRAVAPVLESIQAEREDLRIVKLDFDTQKETALKYGVQSLPTMILFRNGGEATRIVGAGPKPALLARLEPALAA